MIVIGLLLETYLHFGRHEVLMVGLHLALAAICAGLYYFVKTHSASRPALGLFIIWAVMHASLMTHFALSPDGDQELTRLSLAATVIATAALILPTTVGNWTLAISSCLLLLLFWRTIPGEPIAALSIPLVVTFIALLIRSARRWGIRQRLLRLALAEELHQQSLELRETQAGLAMASRLSTEFAHHFNNQLQAVLLAAEGASRALETGHPAADLLATVRDSTLHGAEMIEALLRYGDDKPLNRTQFRANDLLRDLDVSAILTDPAVFKTDVEAIWLSADRELLTLVVVELLRNANRAMTKSGGEITLSINRDGQMINLIVSDNGAGVPTNLLYSATDPFVTTDPIARFGLGLAICENIAKRHGGRLSVFSVEGQGTRVCVEIAAADE